MLEHLGLSAIHDSSNAGVVQGRVAGAAGMGSSLEAQTLHGRSPCLFKIVACRSDGQQPSRQQACKAGMVCCAAHRMEAKAMAQTAAAGELLDCTFPFHK